MSLLQKLYVNIKVANVLPLLHVASMIVVLNVSHSIQEKDQGVQTVLVPVMATIFVTSLPQDLWVAIVIVTVTVYHHYHQLLFVVWVDVILKVVLVVIVEETKITQ